MATRRLLRCSVASLLGLVTLVAATLGYTKWQVEQAERRLDEIKSAGAFASATSRESSWLEYVATGKKAVRSARHVILSVRIFEDGYFIGDRSPFEPHLSQEEMLLKVKELADSVKAFGVPEFTIRVPGGDRDETLERELEQATGADVVWLPPAIPEVGEF